MRVIDGALQEWEAENVKPGPSQITCDTGYLDADDAQGIRRRIQKRAIAGDDQAQAGKFAESGDNQHSLKEGGPDIVRTLAAVGGNSAAYLAARLKKAGRDDLLKQIGPGKKHQSVRSAAIEAGIIIPFPSLQLKDPAPTAQ